MRGTIQQNIQFRGMEEKKKGMNRYKVLIITKLKKFQVLTNNNYQSYNKINKNDYFSFKYPIS